MEEMILDKFHSGYSLDSYQVFGAHEAVENGNSGCRFTVWAPYAYKIELIGEFNEWDGEKYNLVKISDRGVWSLFVNESLAGKCYKYKIYAGNQILEKSDPYAFFSELRPNTSSIVYNLDTFNWNDEYYLSKRTKNFDQPVNIYEVHAGSWKRKDNNEWLSYQELVQVLIPYCLNKGYTHIEFLPLLEHPHDGSWGYQTSGYYSCTSRYGTPLEFMAFVDECHRNNLGVIMDMVLVHFVKNDFGLINFDGTRLYEYLNDDAAFSEWDTMNFDLGKEEIRSFLMSSTAFWIEYFHVDGIRFDAVKNLIYWDGNIDRGVNQVSLDFIKRLNYLIHQNYPTVMLIAEDSSAFAKVTKPTLEGGLGFDYKWDLGWMNDTLKYYELDPLYRVNNHHILSFSMDYFYSEKFLLPLSHDEVVHGKKAIINKMWGNFEQKVAQVKNLYLYQYTHPGKKLNFMGNEIAMETEWCVDNELDWSSSNKEINQQISRFINDISHIYRYTPALFTNEYSKKSFKWIQADNSSQQIFSYYREYQAKVYVIILNMSPLRYENFKLEVPYYGKYHEMINSEWEIYGGCNLKNNEAIIAMLDQDITSNYQIEIKLAPFAAIIFETTKHRENLEIMINSKLNQITKIQEKISLLAKELENLK